MSLRPQLALITWRFALVLLQLGSTEDSFSAEQEYADCEDDAASLLQGLGSISQVPQHSVPKLKVPMLASNVSPQINNAWTHASLTQELALLDFDNQARDFKWNPTPGSFHPLPLFDSDRWALLCMCFVMGAALCLNCITAQHLAVFTLLVLWIVSSVAMNIVNKIALRVLPLPMTLLMIQMLIAVVILCILCGPGCLLKEICAHPGVSARWSLLTLFFAAGLITSMLALQTGSVTFLLVVRNAMPLFSLLVERQVLPLSSTRPITWETICALITLASGTALYASADLQVSRSWNALLWVMSNMAVMVTYRLAERRLLWDMPRSLSFGALNLLQNACGLLPIGTLFIVWGEHRVILQDSGFFKLAHWHDPLVWLCILFSGCAGLALGYYSTKLQKELTATTMLALQSSMKVIIIFLAMLVLGEHLGSWSAIGCAVSLLGGIWYAWVASRPVSSEMVDSKVGK